MSDEPMIVMFPGKGPAIRGTRITVYDILDYHKHGHSPDYIASILPVSAEQIRAAIEYIEAHKEEVMPRYEKMVALAEAGNPPHIRAKLEESHKKLMTKLEELRRQKEEGQRNARAAG